MSETLRLDLFLFYARFLKSRSLAAELCRDERVRLSGRVIEKAAALVRVGDVLTFPQGNRIRVIRVLTLPSRRGPAAEAQACFEDLAPLASPAAERQE